MRGITDFQFVQSGKIHFGITRDQIKTHIGAVGLGIHRQKFCLLTNHPDQPVREKSMAEIRHNHQVVLRQKLSHLVLDSLRCFFGQGTIVEITDFKKFLLVIDKTALDNGRGVLPGQKE